MCQDNIFEKTYAEHVEELGDFCCQNVDFFLEGCDSIRSIYMNEDDARVFFGCMNIYDVYGVNCFHYYLALKRGAYGDFSHGIVRGIGSNNSHFQMDSIEYQLKELINVLRFFQLVNIRGYLMKNLKMRIAMHLPSAWMPKEKGKSRPQS